MQTNQYVKVFKLPEYILLESKSAAQKQAQKYNNFKSAPYGMNSVKMHEIGKIGEFGVLYALNELFNLNIEAKFKDTDSEADIIIKSTHPNQKDLRIEIKSYKTVVWNTLHATISDKQLNSIKQKADIVLYCSVHKKSGTIHLCGFNYTDAEHEDLLNSEIMIQETKSKMDIKSIVLNERPMNDLYNLIKEYEQ